MAPAGLSEVRAVLAVGRTAEVRLGNRPRSSAGLCPVCGGHTSTCAHLDPLLAAPTPAQRLPRLHPPPWHGLWFTGCLCTVRQTWCLTPSRAGVSWHQGGRIRGRAYSSDGVKTSEVPGCCLGVNRGVVPPGAAVGREEVVLAGSAGDGAPRGDEVAAGVEAATCAPGEEAPLWPRQSPTLCPQAQLGRAQGVLTAGRWGEGKTRHPVGRGWGQGRPQEGQLLSLNLAGEETEEATC